MVKAGVYLLMRLNPVLGGTPEWQMLLPLFGGTTLIIGAVLACRQTDLKLMLAYTTMASLGLLVMLTGLGFPHAIEAAALYLVAHSLFKGALFMVAGIIDHETGTRDVTKLGGLRSAMLLTFVIALAAALSMGGLPPFFGFLAKEEIYYALPSFDRRAMVFASLAILGNALMFAVAFAVALKPFIGAKIETPKSPHEAPLLLWLGPALLAAKGLSAALLSNLTHELVSTPMATAIAGEPRQITISAIPAYRHAAGVVLCHHRSGHCLLSQPRPLACLHRDHPERHRLGAGSRFRSVHARPRALFRRADPPAAVRSS